jgi:hypothetical protein
MFGFFLRIFLVQYHVPDTDEITFINNARLHIDSDREWLKLALTTDITRTSILQLLCCRWFFVISHHEVLSLRLLSVILGTLTIPLIFLVWRNISSSDDSCFEALMAAAMASSLVYHVCWSRDGHGEINMTFFYILYIFIASKVFTAHYSSIKLLLGSGMLLFLGFCSHGTMFIAPFGILLFAFLDLLVNRIRLPRWQPCDVKKYVPLLVSGFIFAIYVTYLLFQKGAIVDVPTGDAQVPMNVYSLSPFITFLKSRWQPFITNMTEPWWNSYGISQPFAIILKGLALLGMSDVLVRRQKREWFLLIEPLIWSVTISFLITSGGFERHFHPLVLTLTCAVARGISVSSKWFKAVLVSRVAMSTVILLSLSVISVYGLFLEQPDLSKRYVQRFYGGRKTSLMNLMEYIKKSERGVNSIVCTSFWLFPHYANMFQLNIQFLPSSALRNAIKNHQELPVFVIIPTQTALKNQEFIEMLNQRYTLIRTSNSYNLVSLYELRDDAQTDFQ